MASLFAFSCQDSIWTPPVLSRSGSFTSSPSWSMRSPGSSSSGPRSPVNGVSSTRSGFLGSVPMPATHDNIHGGLLDSASWRLPRWCAWAEDAEWAEAAAKAARLHRAAQAKPASNTTAPVSAVEHDAADAGDFALVSSCVECLGL